MFTRGSYCSFAGVLDRLVPSETQFRPQNLDPRLPVSPNQAKLQGGPPPAQAQSRNVSVASSVQVQGAAGPGLASIISGIAAGLGTDRSLVKITKIQQTVRSNITYRSAGSAQPSSAGDQAAEFQVALANMLGAGVGGARVLPRELCGPLNTFQPSRDPSTGWHRRRR